jgi:acetylornithine deacetylase
VDVSWEQQVTGDIAARADELVALAAELIAFDTTAGPLGAPSRDEAALQARLAERLSSAGAEVDLWEPGPEVVAGSRQVPDGFRFDGRPQLAARFPGSGGGASMLLNGHVDVVSSGPPGAWTSHPFRPEVRDGLLFGRGACDMKGGVAAMVFAAEALRRLEVPLRGDLTVCTVSDEEATGAGAIAAVARGVRADVGIVAEPTSFDVWVACRGDVIPTITVPGRLGHAGIEHSDVDGGGAVNAIEKAAYLLAALRELHEEWQTRPDHRHVYLSPGHVVPTVISGGDWAVNVPDSCRMTLHVAYLPAHADDDGWGTRVESEVAECVRRAAAADPWLAEHPPAIEWSVDIPAAEVDPSHPVVELALAAGEAVGRRGRRAGLDSWHDGATFTRFGGTPTVAFGPREIKRAHAVDECVPIDDLVACSQALAVAAIRQCG